MVTKAELLLTFTQPVSHHDPAMTDKSNTLLFNRQKQMLPRSVTAVPPNQSEIDAVAAMLPVPGDIAAIMSDVGYSEFVACALVKVFVDMYNSPDGAGLFSGMQRYERLESRIRNAAVRATTLRHWWNRLADEMQVRLHGGDDDRFLLSCFALSPGTQESVLRALAAEHRSVVSLARAWHGAVKQQSAAYAAKTGTEQGAASETLRFDVARVAAEIEGASVRDVEVPAIQGNAVRHQCVRGPLWLHLVRFLGIPYSYPGEGALPAGVEALFVNGGNIEGGAKQPSNPHKLAWEIRRAFPSLDLLGGTTDSFDLTESRLKVAPWIVCRENRDSLLGSVAYDLPAAEVSVFDMLTEVTQTRMATRQGAGQMIYNCEALAAGSRLLVRFTLDAYTPDITKGAFVAAIETFLTNNPHIGGQKRVGFGACTGEWLKPIEGAEGLRELYESYLEENREALLLALESGKLGTETAVVS